MSVALMIYYKDATKEMLYIPISGHGTFINYWQPLSTQLNLKTVIKFDSWMQVYDKTDVEPILEELVTLKTFLQDLGNSQLPENVYYLITTTVDRLINELSLAFDNWDEIDHVSFC